MFFDLKLLPPYCTSSLESWDRQISRYTSQSFKQLLVSTNAHSRTIIQDYDLDPHAGWWSHAGIR